ncbi:MAG: CoA-binding protein [Micrococcales bacterium]|uniref:CoA-binding protein n=1 Tax=Phycicoccus sp. TaxID=1902410 RepID=UPI00198582E6|nr:CoA-binding protein [Phycicoccus sp.]MBD3781918.1 CoA-binding protein [Micrococcales bacterium]HMM93710.1 CoA-binding protein [Phycicoccus sp.]
MGALSHQNDPDLIRELLMDPGIWVVVGLSNNRSRPAWSVSRWMTFELGTPIIPVHPKAETVHGAQGYASIADIPDQDLKVVDCFVNSSLVGAVVDEAIEHKDRLMLDAIWMQVGVVDPDAADRARRAGLDVVMDTCPKIEWPKVRRDGMQR